MIINTGQRTDIPAGAVHTAVIRFSGSPRG